MKAVILYSGYTRTWEKCKPNHAVMLPGEKVEYHRNENTCNLEFYQFGINEYETNKAPETGVKNVLNQWHNNFMCFAQCSPNDGDVFVRNRYDIHLTDIIDFSKYEYNDHVVYIPSGHDYREGVNDQFAFGNYNAMRTYYSVYLNHSKLFEQGHMFHTESYLTKNLRFNSVEIVRIPAQTILVRE